MVLCFDCGAFLCNYCQEYHKYNKEYQGHSMSQLKELRGRENTLYNHYCETSHVHRWSNTLNFCYPAIKMDIQQ